ncbi:hypothetical protein EW145_g7293 [Phellinidium pouzarii]|uniref:Uncharacterized protein n=1 Tax=Phellinidium pouzarii TaxID=167371 RepID=A0A4S4KR31_9AGAM|nr:hypothetical protein EW145_g7293 [Phellinidium pouzarii]
MFDYVVNSSTKEFLIINRQDAFYPPNNIMPVPFNDRLSFDKTLGAYIEFPTCSDAMLSSLTLALGVDYTVMDAVFCIVKHSSFNPSELTLHGTEDVYAHVANRRSQEAAIMTTRGVRSGLSLVPQVVIERVIEVIGDELEVESRSFATEMPSLGERTSRKKKALQKILSNASLVQRSWVQPARRALGRSLTLANSSRESLLDSLRMPLLGPWTRDLAVLAPEEDQPALFAKTLRSLLSERLTAVTSISLKARRRDILILTSIFKFLPFVKEVKLEVYHECEGFVPIPTLLFQAITSLQYLERLSLNLPDWTPTNLSAHELPSELSPMVTSPYFRSVHLFGVSPAEHISWSRNQHGGFSLTTLEKKFNHKGGSLRHYPTTTLHPIVPLLPRLDDLRLIVAESGNVALPRILKHCVDIRRLYFESDDFPSDEVLGCIPNPIEMLAFQFTMDFRRYSSNDLEPWAVLDIQLQRYLEERRFSRLRALRVYMRVRSEGLMVCSKGRYQFRVMQDIRLRRVEAICAESGIDFRFSHQPDRRGGHWID